MKFTKELDTYTHDLGGKQTKDRFVRMTGYGYDVHITFCESGYIGISVSPDTSVEHGEFFPNIFIHYDDITPKQAVAEFNHQRMLTAEKLEAYMAELARTKEAILAFNELLLKLGEI